MEAYSGIGVLEIMDSAKNYNAYIANLIAAESLENKILDFGAGSGAFAKALRERGFHVICVEQDPQLRSTLSNLGFTAYPTLAECPDQFSFIYSINVLEHIEQDGRSLEELHHKLLDGGKILIYVPAFMELYTAFDKKIGHLRRYTKKSLLRLVPQFHVQNCHYVDSIGFLAALLYKWIGAKDGSVSISSVKIYDRFLFPVSRLLDFICRPFIGKNLLLVARKGR
jgi:SAM-dependent methyltransferase